MFYHLKKRFPHYVERGGAIFDKSGNVANMLQMNELPPTLRTQQNMVQFDSFRFKNKGGGAIFDKCGNLLPAKLLSVLKKYFFLTQINKLRARRTNLHRLKSHLTPSHIDMFG